jgi:Lrp/AsnC family transcriptional regulator
MLDDLDRRLLRLLQEDPAHPVPDLAAACSLTPGRAARRLDRLREAGILRGQEARIDWARLGYAVHVSLRVTLDKGTPRAFEDFLATAREVPEVVEIQTFLGQVDVRLAVIARDLAHYRAIYRDRILTLPRISDIEALMTLSVIKDDEALPL